MVTFVTLLLACVSVCISNDKCVKGNNKENEKNSKVSCKGGKLYKAHEKLVFPTVTKQ